MAGLWRETRQALLVFALVGSAICCGPVLAQEQETGDRQESLAQFVHDTIMADGLAAGLEMLERYNDPINADSSKFYFSDREFFRTAHTLFQSGNMEAEALEVLRLLPDKFPRFENSLAHILFLTLHEQGVDSARKWLIENQGNAEFYLSDFELYLASNTFYEAGKIPEARVLAEVLLQEFPAMANAHERMAEIHLAEGNADLALQKYRDRMALSRRNSFFKLAIEPPSTYQPTVLPRDPELLFEAEGNFKSGVVFVFVQGGPDPDFGVYREDPLSLLPNQEGIIRVNVREAQMHNRNLLGSNPVLTEDQALYEHKQSAEMLHRTVKYWKSRGKQVFVIGHSYGCMIGLEYLYSKENLADRVVLMGSDPDEDLRNFPESVKGKGRIVRWIDGVEPYERSFFPDFPLLPLLEKDLNRIFANTDLLVAAHAKRRFTELLKGKDLSNVIFAHGKFDESNGRSKPHELEFLRAHGAKTIETYGDHHSMLSPAFMENLYEHLLQDIPLKKSLASTLSDDIDRDGIDVAIEKYEQNKNSDAFHRVVETEMNKLGYILLGEQKIDEAIAVLQLNVVAFPRSWNAFDSLGEAFLLADNAESARENYEQSLMLHPGNRYGIEALRKIDSQKALLESSQPNNELAGGDISNVSFETQDSSETLTAGVDETVRQCMEQSHLPGAAIVIVKDGKTIFKRGYGLANVEQQTAVDPDRTLFRIGSISKALTLLTLARQVELGRLKLDDDVAQFVDNINNISGGANPVTVYNLLTHTSGFDQLGGSDRQVYDFQRTLAERKEMRHEIAAFLQENRLRRVSAPGEYFRYDTYGSTLAGLVLERVTELPYEEAMKQEMFARIGMTRSFVEVDPEYFDDLATGYGFVEDEYVAQPYEVFVTTPASSIDATPADMGRLLEALTGGGANSHGRLFQQEMISSVLGSQFRSHPEFVGTTHGLFESCARSGQFEKPVRSVGHGGSMRGYIATLEVFPEHNLGIFLVTNRAPEAGGGNVHLGPVIEKVIGNLPNVATREPYPVPEPDAETDLSEYVGDYYYGVFCHSGTPAEFAAGSWRRGRSRAVTQDSGTLTISGDKYMPRGDDVFVRADGLRMVYFGRNEKGKISFYLFSSSADTFERVED